MDGYLHSDCSKQFVSYLLALFVSTTLAVRRSLSICVSQWMYDRDLSVTEETHSNGLATESSYMLH